MRCRFEIRRYNEETLQTETLVTAADSQHLSYTLPSPCKEWVAYQMFNHATSQSTVWLRDITNGISEQLTPSIGNKNHIFPVIFHSNEMEIGVKDEGEQCGSCVLMWIESAAGVALDSNGNNVLNTQTGAISDAVVHTLEIPCRHWSAPLTEDIWKQVYELGAHVIDDEFSIIFDMLPDNDQIFFLLGKPESGGDISQYKVRIRQMDDGTMRDIPETISRYPLSFQGVNDGAILMWQHRNNTDVGHHEKPEGQARLCKPSPRFLPHTNRFMHQFHLLCTKLWIL